MTTKKQGKSIEETYGAYYYKNGEVKRYETDSKKSLYFYTVYHGNTKINVENGDSVIYLSNEKKYMIQEEGPCKIHSEHFGVVIRGYMNGYKKSSIGTSNLPYINGCSSREIFPPERVGDPTSQLLFMPPFTSEQRHHVHSTARVVYVLSGRGYSIVGMNEHHVRQELTPGMTIVLEKFSPHHFETEDDSLEVLPVHIFSSSGAGEFNHPMYNGTHIV